MSDSCFAILDGSQLDSFVGEVVIPGWRWLGNPLLALLAAQRRDEAEPGKGAASDERA
jgi:hypothetical protein